MNPWSCFNACRRTLGGCPYGQTLRTLTKRQTPQNPGGFEIATLRGNRFARRYLVQNFCQTRTSNKKVLECFSVRFLLLSCPYGVFSGLESRVPALSQIYYQDHPQNGEYSRWGHRTTRMESKKSQISAAPDGRTARRGRRGCIGNPPDPTKTNSIA